MEMMDAELWGWTFIAVLFQACWWLHAIIPAAEGSRKAYACDSITGEALSYNTNALRVMGSVVIGAVCLVQLEVVGASDLADHYWPAARAAFFFGVVASLILYNRGLQVLGSGQLDQSSSCLTVAGARSAAAADTKEFAARSTSEHFFSGYEWNPRGAATGIDLKVPPPSLPSATSWPRTDLPSSCKTHIHFIPFAHTPDTVSSVFSSYGL